MSNSNLIRRDVAIVTAVKAAIDWHKLANPQYSIAYCIGEAIEQLPSEGDPKADNKGRWKRTYLDHEAMGERPSIFYCSECNQCIPFPTNFCPACGADMRGEEE